jgi:D-glycero-alpha-D-manno-heptose-7-phosphate kinase
LVAKAGLTPHIEEVYNAAMKASARACDVSVEGNGDFIMIFVPPDKRMDVIRTLNGFEGQVSNCHFAKYGTQAWRL